MPSDRRAYRKAHHEANREHDNAVNKAWRLAHPERMLAYGRAWYQRNKAGEYLALRAWQKENPEKVRTQHATRRARNVGAVGSHTTQEWREKLELFAGCCFYCGETRPLTRDHKVPLARGGTNFIDNLVPACFSCNSRKHTKTAQEFLAARLAA